MADLTNPRVRLSADIGGTFTDIVAELPSGIRVTSKVLTTPTAPERAVLEGASQLLERSALSLKDVGVFVHGTTLATNAILERRGAKTARSEEHTSELQSLQRPWYAPSFHHLSLHSAVPISPREAFRRDRGHIYGHCCRIAGRHSRYIESLNHADRSRAGGTRRGVPTIGTQCIELKGRRRVCPRHYACNKCHFGAPWSQNCVDNH